MRILVKHKQLGREDNKKFFYRAVSVKEGDFFCLEDKNEHSFKLHDNEPGDSLLDSTIETKRLNVDYMGCFDKDPVDSCEITYSSLITLEI